MNKNAFIAIVIIALIAGGLWWYLESANQEIDNLAGDAGSSSESKNRVNKSASGNVDLAMDLGTGVVKEFTVTGDTSFRFSPGEMRVKVGDRVKVTFVNAGGMHDWNLAEFKVATKKLSAGQQETIEFVAHKKGTFEYYCSVGSHRQMGIKGN